MRTAQILGIIGAGLLLTSSTQAEDRPLRDIVREVVKVMNASSDKPDARAMVEIARVQEKVGDHDAAIANLRRASELAAAMKQSVSRQGNTTTYGLSSARTLAMVGSAQKELGDKPGALATLRKAAVAEDAQESDHGRFEAWSILAKNLTALGAKDEALALAARADVMYAKLGERANDQSVIPQIAGIRAAAGDLDGAFAMLDKLALGPKDPSIKQAIIGKSLGNIAVALEVADRAVARESLTRVLGRIEDIPMAEDKYFSLGEIAHALARIGDYDGAMKAARLIGEGPSRAEYDMRDGKPYAMLLVAIERRKAGDLKGARATLREGYQTAKAIDESRGKSGRLYQIASGMLLAGDVDGALLCVESMIPERRPEILTLIGSAQRRNGDDQAAQTTFQRALKEGETARGDRSRRETNEPKLKGILPRTDAQREAGAVREVVKIRAAMGEFDAARKLADTIKDPSIRSLALSDVAREQATAGDAAGALAWVRTLTVPRSNVTPLQSILQGISDREEFKAEPRPKR